MADRALRMGVVGVGHLGRHHARILAARPDVDLVAVVDVDATRAETGGAETHARADTDPDTLLSHVDAVTLAVPTEAHQRVAMPFLRQGVPVLVEKPIAASVAQADEMIDAAAHSGATLAVGHTERYNPAITTAMPLITAPQFVEVHRLAAFPGRSLDIDVVFDLMIHDLDVVLAVVNAEPVSIQAVGIPVLSDRADIANARIRFTNGCIANLRYRPANPWSVSWQISSVRFARGGGRGWMGMLVGEPWPWLSRSPRRWTNRSPSPVFVARPRSARQAYGMVRETSDASRPR
jgi:predicted dehydrogenase